MTSDETSKWERAVRTALSTVCRCQTPLDQAHDLGCPIYQFGFTAARELIGVPDAERAATMRATPPVTR